MKKLSALIAMVLCLTIGGVYAAWTYTNDAADVTDVHKTLTIGLTSATASGAVGDYYIETNITGITIEQNGETNPSYDFHKAVLEFHTSDAQDPYITIKLDLRPDAEDTALQNLTTTYEISIVDVADQYLGSDIFNDKKTGAQAQTAIAAGDWQPVDVAQGIYSYTITNFADEFELNDFVLGTKAEHTTFGTALGNPNLRIDVSDGTAA